MTQDTDEIIKKIKHLVSIDAGVDDFLELVEALLTESLASPIPTGVSLFRTTGHHQIVPARIEEIWFPPAKTTSLGRANREGQSVFYCSSDPNCTFHEVKVKVGQIAVFAEWVNVVPMLLHDLGYTKHVLNRAGSKRELPEKHRLFYEKLNETQMKTRDFLALAFTEPTAVKYSLTAAIAETHRGTSFSGLMYPSIQKSGAADNLALDPEFVRTSLHLKNARVMRINKIRDDGTIESTTIYDLERVDAEGVLHWKNAPDARRITPRDVQPWQPGETICGPCKIKIDEKWHEFKEGTVIQLTSKGILVRDYQGNIVLDMPVISNKIHWKPWSEQ